VVQVVALAPFAVGSVDGVAVALELVEPSVGQVVTCVSEPATAPSAPLAAPAVEAPVGAEVSVDEARTRLVAWVLALWWVAAA
jgi:hypothetical protein